MLSDMHIQDSCNPLSPNRVKASKKGVQMLLGRKDGTDPHKDTLGGRFRNPSTPRNSLKSNSMCSRFRKEDCQPPGLGMKRTRVQLNNRVVRQNRPLHEETVE